jgi:hypothetical protein
MNRNPRHEAAIAGATALVEVVEPLLRGEERRLCHEEFYRICMAMLEDHELQGMRQGPRLLPSCN